MASLPFCFSFNLLLFWVTLLLGVAQQWSGLCLEGDNKASLSLSCCCPLGVDPGAVLVPSPCLAVLWLLVLDVKAFPLGTKDVLTPRAWVT